MADRLCSVCIKCFSSICAVFCRDMSMKTSYVIQFVIYVVLQGYNVASDIGMFFDVFNAVQSCEELGGTLPAANTTQGNGSESKIYCRQPGNFTFSNLAEHITTLMILQWFILVFAVIGVGLYMAHLCTLVPNLCRHCRDPDFEQDVPSPDTPKYYRNIITIHTMFMILESFIHDIPVSCLAMELSVHYFGPAEINCWECAASPSSIPAELSLKRGSLWIGLKVSAVAFISVYKGILPLYSWIGNPFCWSCYPLRFLIASPAAFLFVVMVLTPCMGVAKYRVIESAPALASEVGSVSDVIWTIGLVFWGIVIGMVLMYLLFKKFVFEMCPCLSWCVDENSKKKDNEKKSPGCLCF